MVTVLKVAPICEPSQAGGGDDANSDQGGDEAVLDGRCTRLVLHETLDMVLHDNSPN